MLWTPEPESQSQSHLTDASSAASETLVVQAAADSVSLSVGEPSQQKTSERFKAMLHKKDLTIRRLRAKLRTMSKPKLPKQNRAALAMQKARQRLATPKGNSFEIVKAGKMKDGRAGRLTLPSMFAVGIRRSLANVAAADFGLINCLDISGQTVGRCEEKASGAVNILMKDFIGEILHQARTVFVDEESDSWTAAAFGMRSDGTNSRIWRRQKLHVLEASASYVSDFSALAANDLSSAISRRRCVTLA